MQDVPPQLLKKLATSLLHWSFKNHVEKLFAFEHSPPGSTPQEELVARFTVMCYDEILPLCCAEAGENIRQPAVQKPTKVGCGWAEHAGVERAR